MKKQIKIGVVALFAFVGLVFLMGDPSEGLNWFAVMFWKSVAGFGCWGVAALLWRRWDSRGELLDEVEDVEI